MAKALIIGSMVLCTSAIVLVIVSLATSNWMTACFNPDGISEQQLTTGGFNSNTSISVSQLSSLYPAGVKYCINSGLFGIKMIQEDQRKTTSINLSVREPKVHVKIAAAFLIIGILLVFPALIFFGLCIFGDSFLQGKNLSVKLLKNIGLVLLIVGSLFWGFGGVAYVIPQSAYINNPLSYIMETYRGIGMGAGSNPFSDGTGEIPGGMYPPNFHRNGGVSPTYPDTGAIGYPLPFDINDQDLVNVNSNGPVPVGYPDTGAIGYPSDSNDDLIGVNSNSSGNTGAFSSESYGNTDFSIYNDTYDVFVYPVDDSHDDSVSTMDVVKKFVRPEFGFSFYLAWVAFALCVLATVLAGVGFNSMLKEKRKGQQFSSAS